MKTYVLAAVIVAVLGLSIGFYVIFTNPQPPTSPLNLPNSLSAPSESALMLVETGTLVVGNAIVTKDDVEREYEKVPPPVKQTMPIEKFADTIINKKLLQERAEAKGVAVSENQARESLESLLASKGMTWEDFERDTATQGQDPEQILAAYQEQMTAMLLLSQEVDLDIEVNQQEVDDAVEAEDLSDLLDPVQKAAFRGKVEDRLLQLKQTRAIAEYVNELREEAGPDPME